MVQWFKLCASNAGLIPSQGIKNLYAAWYSQKKCLMILSGIYCMHSTLLGATGRKVNKAHNMLVLGCVQQHLKLVDTRRLGEGLN